MARTKAAENTAAETTKPVTETEKKETATKKAPAKKTTTKKAETAAKEAETVKETAAKKAPAKKTAAKKAAEPQVTVTVQLQGKEDIVAANVVEAAKKAYAQANPDGEIKTIDVYVKPEEGVAYYAVNGEGSADYKVEL